MYEPVKHTWRNLCNGALHPHRGVAQASLPRPIQIFQLLVDAGPTQLAVIFWVVGSLLVRLYAQWTLESGSMYGSLSAPLVLLLWLYVVGLAVLLGAELNSEIEKLWPSGQQPGGLGPSPQPQS